MSWSGTKCLVTGASGFLGRNLVPALLKRGCSVSGVFRNAFDDVSLTAMEVVTADLALPEAAQSILERVKPDLIFHLAGDVFAGEDRDLVLPMFHNNAAATVYLLNAAANSGCQRVVTISSIEEYGGTETPLSPYGVAKRVASLYADHFQAAHHLPVTQVLLNLAYGPYQAPKKFIPYVITSYLQGQTPVLGTPERECDFVYIDDVIAGLLQAAERPGDDAILEIRSGHCESLMDTAGHIKELLGSRVHPAALPLPNRKALSQLKPGDPRITSDWGWYPLVSRESGLRKTIEWYRNNLTRRPEKVRRVAH